MKKPFGKSLLGSLLALALVAGACGDSNSNDDDGATSDTTSESGGGGDFAVPTTGCPADASTKLAAGAPIKLGISLPQSGQLAAFDAIRQGMNISIKKANDAGGVDGHPIELIAKDDAYEAARTVVNLTEMIDKDKIFASVGIIGTPNVAATRDKHEKTCTPQLNVNTGFPAWGDWPRLFDRSILIAGLTLAFIASAESLLTATAVDSMQQHAPRTKYDRELAAQGVGNVVCGVLGVLPLTGVIVRSGANVQAGAQTRLSAILHGLWLLLFAVVFTFVLRLIPVSCLAAILVYTGCKLVNIKAVRELGKYGKGEVAVYVVTLAVIVVIDLLTGIVMGLGLAVVQLVYRFTHLTIWVERDTERNRTTLYLKGAATFLRLPKLAQALQGIPPDTELHVHFEDLAHIDHACLDLLMKWGKQHEATGGSLVLDWESLTAKFRQVKKNNGKNGRAET
ncbi:MAG: solute carrier family 23 protein, partial [Acidimicrobiales bacterium]|nr:solute carrier family 23 protein [Acidimicrobiales bacterium]